MTAPHTTRPAQKKGGSGASSSSGGSGGGAGGGYSSMHDDDDGEFRIKDTKRSGGDVEMRGSSSRV